LTNTEKEALTVATSNSDTQIAAPTARELADHLIAAYKIRDAASKMRMLGNSKDAEALLQKVADAHQMVKEVHESVSSYAADLAKANPSGEDDTATETSSQKKKSKDPKDASAYVEPASFSPLEKALRTSGRFSR
jgi:hypothetical protein